MTRTKKQAAQDKRETKKKLGSLAGVVAVVAGAVSYPLWKDDPNGNQYKSADMPTPAGWYDTGDEITTSDTTLRIYARKFPAGRVELGGNECAGGNCSMYIVAIKANPCPADLDGDGLINFTDLAIIKSMMHSNNPAGDANSDGIVNAGDAAFLKERIFTEC